MHGPWSILEYMNLGCKTMPFSVRRELLMIKSQHDLLGGGGVENDNNFFLSSSFIWHFNFFFPLVVYTQNTLILTEQEYNSKWRLLLTVAGFAFSPTASKFISILPLPLLPHSWRTRLVGNLVHGRICFRFWWLKCHL